MAGPQAPATATRVAPMGEPRAMPTAAAMAVMAAAAAAMVRAAVAGAGAGQAEVETVVAALEAAETVAEAMGGVTVGRRGAAGNRRILVVSRSLRPPRGLGIGREMFRGRAYVNSQPVGRLVGPFCGHFSGVSSPHKTVSP